MLTEREFDKVVLWSALPFFFGALWLAAGARLALDLGEIYDVR
jgi:hypothetical protein